MTIAASVSLRPVLLETKIRLHLSFGVPPCFDSEAVLLGPFVDVGDLALERLLQGAIDSWQQWDKGRSASRHTCMVSLDSHLMNSWTRSLLDTPPLRHCSTTAAGRSSSFLLDFGLHMRRNVASAALYCFSSGVSSWRGQHEGRKRTYARGKVHIYAA